MRDRRDVSNRGDFQPGDLQPSQGRFPTGARTIHENCQRSNAIIDGHTSGIFRGHLSRERGAFPRAFKALSTGGRPADNSAGLIRDRHDSVVERALDERNSIRDFATSLLLARLFRSCGSSRGFFTGLFRGFLTSFFFFFGRSFFTHASSPLLRDFKLFAHGDRLTRSLTSASIGVGTLTSHGKIFSVAKATICLEIHQTLDVHSDRAPKFTLHRVILLNMLANLGDLVLTEDIGLLIGIDVYRFEDFRRKAPTDAEDIGESNFDAFISRKVNSSNTCHALPLPLLMSRIFTRNTDDPATSKYPTFITNFLY